MKPTRPAAILFDLDGTLVDTAPDFGAVVNLLRQQSGLEALPYARIREQVSNGGAALTRLTWGIDEQSPDFAERRNELLNCYQEHLGVASAFFTGFPKTLQKLEQAGIRWGIVTNKPRRFTTPLLDALGIQADSVVCGDDVPTAKPAPDALIKGAKELRCSPQECWYVGDHSRDIEAAKAANMFSIGALFGYIEPDDNPQHWGADTLIQHPEELLALL
jgi:phosphoglycolate phosphatase